MNQNTSNSAPVIDRPILSESHWPDFPKNMFYNYPDNSNHVYNSEYPEPTSISLQDDILVIDNVLSEIECKWLIDNLNKNNPKSWNPKADFNDHRIADTIETFYPSLSNVILSRIKQFIPTILEIDSKSNLYTIENLGTWNLDRLNPLLLFVKYTKGGHFAPHSDGQSVIDINNRTFFPTVLYLNSIEKGNIFK